MKTNCVAMLKGMLFGVWMMLAIGYSQDLAWVYNIGGPGEDLVSDIETDIMGNMYITGGYSGTIDFDLGSGIDLHTSVGQTDAFIIKLDSNGNYVWGISFGGTGYDGYGVIYCDSTGNIYIAAALQGAADMDPGGGIYSVNAGAGQGAVIAKYSVLGSLIFASAFFSSASGNYYPTGLCVSDSGNVLVTGSLQDWIDLDPGAGVVGINSNNYSTDVILVSLSATGAYLWHSQFDSREEAYGGDIAVLSTGDIILGIYYYTGILDVDPGPDSVFFNTPLIGTMPGSSGMLIKLNNVGAYKDCFAIGDSSGIEALYSLKKDKDDHLYISGFFYYIDFDPGPGLDTLIANGPGFGVYLACLDSNFNKIWARSIENISFFDKGEMDISPDSKIVFSGIFRDSIDIDPGPSRTVLYSSFPSAIEQVALTIDANGYFIGGFKTGKLLSPYFTSYPSTLMDVELDGSGNVYLAGYYSDTIDFSINSIPEVLISDGYFEGFISKYYITGCDGWHILSDSISDILCGLPGFISVNVEADSGAFSFCWNTTPATYFDSVYISSPGLYVVSVLDTLTGCIKRRSFFINGPSAFTGYDFSLFSVTPGAIRPGDTANIMLSVENNGCDTACPVLYTVLDSISTYISAVPLPDSIHGDTLIWILNCTVWPDSAQSVHLTYLVDTSAVLSTVNQLLAWVEPRTADQNKSNNLILANIPVVNSYDPNDKTAFTSRTDGIGLADPNTTIQYLVRFQNTGTAEAIRIGIIDTLDTHLDPRTFKVLGSSHPMQVIALDSNVVKFWFPAIHLPDSNANEPGSHGWIVYQIEQRPDLPYGTEIENTAYIYFDYNPAVITNTTVTTVAPPYVGLSEEFHSKHRLLLFPNPATTDLYVLGLGEGLLQNAVAFSPDGRQFPLQILSDGKQGVSLEGLEEGFYVLRIITNAGQISWGNFVVSVP